jgi:hypothetical protein
MMAKVKIENAKVERLIGNKGFAATEEVKTFAGDTVKAWYTVWATPNVSEGDLVSITGDLSVRLEEYTGADNQPKTKAAAHVNNAKVETAEAPF